jgi:putative transposase
VSKGFKHKSISLHKADLILARAISQCGWREFRVMCEAKSEKFGREFVVINREELTSQVCSECGYKWGKLDLQPLFSL